MQTLPRSGSRKEVVHLGIDLCHEPHLWTTRATSDDLGSVDEHGGLLERVVSERISSDDLLLILGHM